MAIGIYTNTCSLECISIYTSHTAVVPAGIAGIQNTGRRENRPIMVSCSKK
jgi:hypothetical protein